MRRKDRAKERTLSWDARSHSMTVASPGDLAAADFASSSSFGARGDDGD